jgi:protease IV
VMDELKDQFASDSKNNTFRQVTIQNYLANLDGPNISPVTGPRIAVVYAEGDIVDGEGTVGEIGGDRLARAIRKFRFDPDVKGIVLRVNSPGGSALASEVIRRELAAAQNSKPIVVSMGTVAASGGYWISTASNHIFAEPNTITGSIGVFGLEFNFQKIANDNGVTWDGVKTSPFADLFTVSRPKTPAELAVIQGFVDDVYSQFLEHVSKARNLPVDQVGEIAQGRVWSGTQALKIHLIDEFGGLNQAIGYTGKLAGLGETPKIVEYPAKGTLAEKLKEIVGENERPPVSKQDTFTKELRRIELDWAELTRLNDPKGVYARLPFGLRPE